MESFSVAENFFVTGTLPTEIGLWTNIRNLDLLRAGEDAESNGLGGRIPSELGLFTSMTRLEIVSGCQFASALFAWAAALA